MLCHGCNPPRLWNRIYKHWRHNNLHQNIHDQFLLEREQEPEQYLDFDNDDAENDVDLIDHEEQVTVVLAVNVDIVADVVEVEDDYPVFGDVVANENNNVFNGPDAELILNELIGVQPQLLDNHLQQLNNDDNEIEPPIFFLVLFLMLFVNSI